MIHFSMSNDYWHYYGSNKPVNTFATNGPAPQNIPLPIAEEVYKEYAKDFGTSQSLERIGERGGFGWSEMVNLLYAKVLRLEAQLVLAGQQELTRKQIQSEQEQEKRDNFRHAQLCLDGLMSEIEPLPSSRERANVYRDGVLFALRKQMVMLEVMAKFQERLEWLHTGSWRDAEGYEWGVARVKFNDANGQVESFRWTSSDHSDLDAAMVAERKDQQTNGRVAEATDARNPRNGSETPD